ncbi:MAG TPA: AIM24 family protein, partial [Vineibacter sp.]|nr:AIM24 family protein [Vineibacter sp.]
MPSWIPPSGGQPPAPPPPYGSPPPQWGGQPVPAAGMDHIDYRIHGEEMQYVEIELDPGEAAVGEAGSMMYMDAGVGMEAVFGDARKTPSGGFLDKLVGAGKRLLTGESLFTTVYTNQTPYKRIVAFSAPYPGTIIPMSLREMGGTLICQKDAFLCAARGVQL